MSSPARGEEPAVAMSKLEVLKEIQTRTIQLEKMKARMKLEIEKTEEEENCLIDFKREMELLLQEKMAHVEELRQIHADISSMEQVVKQSEQDRNRHLEYAKHLNREFVPLKQQIDKLRQEIELPRLPELHEEDPKIRPDFFEKNSITDWHHSHGSEALNEMSNQPMHLAAAAAVMQRPAVVQQAMSLQPSMHPQHRIIQSGAAPAVGSERPSSTAFRQAPPPMKSCLSCHQQIHRNAPICPLCKAKSRSRNPKKPKRKLDD